MSESQRKTAARDPGRRALPTGAVLLVVIALLAPPSVRADPGVSLDQLRPRASTHDTFTASRPEVPKHLDVEVQLVTDYTKSPLVYESKLGSKSTERSALVSDQLRTNLGASLGLLDFGLVFLQMPIDIVDRGHAFGSQPTATGAGAGDLALGGRVVFFERPLGALAFEIDATLPTANQAHGTPSVAGDSGATMTPTLISELRLPFLRITGNAGIRVRKAVALPGIGWGDELVYSLAASVPLVRDVFEASVEAFGVTPASNVGLRSASPLETLFGLKLHAGRWSFGLAPGIGLLRGYGAPDFRGIALLGFRFTSSAIVRAQQPAPEAEQQETQPTAVAAAPPPPEAAVVTRADQDGDNVPDAEDQCPALWGAADLGGCPEAFQMIAETGRLDWQSPVSWKRRQAKLEAQSLPVLEELGRALQKNPKLHVVLELHTIPEGNASANLQLTMERASVLSNWLTDHGARPEQLDAFGCGGARPIAPLHTRSAGTNERTEVYVVQPLPPNGMPSTLGCQPLPAKPAPAPAPPPNPDALREFGSLHRQCVQPTGSPASPRPRSHLGRTLLASVKNA